MTLRPTIAVRCASSVRHLAQAKHQGVKSRTAAELGIAPNTLKAKMNAFGIE